MTESLDERARQLYSGAALAPMVRASTTPLRTLALQYGADFVYTEELVDRSLFTTVRVENEALGTIDYIKDKSHMSKKAVRRLERDDNSVPIMLRIDRQVEGNKLICQIGSGEPELALQAALHVYQDVAGIDINMGCPKKFSVSGGMGAALLKDPDRACRIIKTLRDQVPNTPISCKIRLLDDVNPTPTIDFCTALINAGAHAIAIHARKTGQDSIVPAHWNMFEQIIPIVATKFPRVSMLLNGDFYTRQEWTDMMQRTGARGVLLGRPALHNTSIFIKPPLLPVESTNDTLPSSTSPISLGYDSPLLLDKTTVVQEYLRHCIHYNTHFKNAKYVVCEMMNNRRAPTERVPFLTQFYPGNQTIGLTCACRSLPEVCQLWNVKLSNAAAAVMPQQAATAAPAGEHRYEDSYFLRSTASASSLPTDAAISSSVTSTTTTKNHICVIEEEEPPLKRPRLDEVSATTTTTTST